jgi:hypothetical protein
LQPQFRHWVRFQLLDRTVQFFLATILFLRQVAPFRSDYR